MVCATIARDGLSALMLSIWHASANAAFMTATVSGANVRPARYGLIGNLSAPHGGSRLDDHPTLPSSAVSVRRYTQVPLVSVQSREHKHRYYTKVE